MASPPSIAIIGAGPAGLCLAALLHKRGIASTVYELRAQPGPDALRAPSGMLDLHSDTGLAAVRACGLYHDFLPLTADCGQGTTIMDKHGGVRHRDEGDGGRPEISRTALASLLLSATPAGCVQWHHKLVDAQVLPSGRVRLDFGPRGPREHDVVVGADGAWSRVRPLVTDARPCHGGLWYTTLHIRDAAGRFPGLSALVGSGSCFVLGDGHGIATHRAVGGAISLHVSVAAAEAQADGDGVVDRTRGLTPAQWEAVAVDDARLFGTWAPADEAAAAPDGLVPPMRPLHMLPIGHTWPSRRGVALVGDAAHLMMSWAGEGVNLALRDALDLAEAISQAWLTFASSSPSCPTAFQEMLLPLVADFERSMFARAREAAQETWDNSKILFSQDGATAMAELLASYGLPQ